MNTCTKQHSAPCKGCPFRRDTPAGELGGSPVTTYIGQAHGPFWLPCHNSKGYSRQTRTDPTHTQCAGAAIFRANNKRDELLPAALLRLPADTDTVFADYAEFAAHHEELDPRAVRSVMEFLSPDELLRLELSKSAARRIELSKE